MADSPPPVGTQNGSTSVTPPVTPKRNPALRMLGMPNIRIKLPSRNWLIFLSITGTFTSMLIYDRYQKKKIQGKWCRLVSHIAREPLDTNVMPRKVTVFLAAPPGDGLRATRDHFVEYVKPILVAGALDWDVVEGRREGEVCAGLAERIRKLRKRAGEVESMMPSSNTEEEDLIDEMRGKGGVSKWSGIQGDIVIGRHTWKEYIRGLHEGWLGPLDSPSESLPNHSSSSIQTSSETTHDTQVNDNQSQSSSFDDPSPSSAAAESPPSPPNPEPTTKSSKPPIPTPLIPTTSYTSASLPPSIPDIFEPTNPLPHPHILGFLNTPIRIYRFLNQRHLADQIGRETAALVLATSTLPYQSSSPSTSSSSNITSITHDDPEVQQQQQREEGEISTILSAEEKDWHKSIKRRDTTPSSSSTSNSELENNKSENIWTAPIILDERIVSRMRKFELDPIAERRAEKIAKGEDEEQEEGGGMQERQQSIWKRWWGKIMNGSRKREEENRRNRGYEYD